MHWICWTAVSTPPVCCWAVPDLHQVFSHQHLVRLMAASCFACAGIIFLLDQAQKQPTVKLLPAARCGVEERLGMTGRQHHQHTGVAVQFAGVHLHAEYQQGIAALMAQQSCISGSTGVCQVPACI